MNRRVDSKSRRPTGARAIDTASNCGNRKQPQATSSAGGGSGGRGDGCSGNVVSGDNSTSALEPTLNHLHISHNYMSPYQKPQWYDPAIYTPAIRKVHLLESLVAFDEQLQALMQSGGFLKDWQQFGSVRLAIQRQFIDLLKFEMKFCRQHNVEQHCWKILYHSVIEYLKRLAGDKSKANYLFYRQRCLDIIDDGIEYFQRLSAILSATYKYEMDDFVGECGGASLRGLKYISLAIVSAQKICIYLGDLLRYREIVSEGKNFEAVKKWYVSAHQLIPANGMPYNQLAVLSLYNKRKFDAVYYHLRSLHASNPIKSAKESLVVLFDEIRKKYEAHRKVHAKETKEPKRRRSENFRREIWIHPMDGQLNYRTVCFDENEDETEVLESAELYKRFITNYLHLQGMFFTKIGTDNLEICIEEVLRDFAELLSHQSSGIMTQQKLVHLIVLNAFAIDCHGGNDDSGALTNLQINALAFAMCFFGLLVEKLLKEFNETISANFVHLKTNNTRILVTDIRSKHEPRADGNESFNPIDINDFALSDFVNNLLAAVLLWCNWMRCNYTIWNSTSIAPTIKQLNEKYGACPWDEFATLITAFGKYCFDENLLSAQTVGGPVHENRFKITKLRLPEDLLVLGLPHLLQTETFYCLADYNKTNMYTVLRIKQIWTFGAQFLCSCDPPLLQTTDSVERVFVKRALGDNDGDGTDRMARAAGVNCCDDKSTDGYASSNSESGMLSSSTGDDRCGSDNSPADRTHSEYAEHLESASEIQQLLQRKSELERSHKLHEKQTRYTQEILRQSRGDTLLIEIRPKYLIPDTNCFIDFLPQLKALAQSHPIYQLVLPLVVVNELEGLAKGERSVDESPTKVPSAQIQTRKSIASQEALGFLQTVTKTIRCATTKGSILNSMAFTKESDNSDTNRNLPMTEHLNNDDKILLTAVNLSQLQNKNVDRNLADINQPSSSSSSTNKLSVGAGGGAGGGTANAPGSKSTMQRRVVLLTNDRNLKVKAIAQNIPVREVSDFVKWSGITH